MDCFSPKIDIVWTKIENYVFQSWKYWKLRSSTFSIILEILEHGFFIFLLSWTYWKLYFFNFLRSWKFWIVRSILSPILEIVDRLAISPCQSPSKSLTTDQWGPPIEPIDYITSNYYESIESNDLRQMYNTQYTIHKFAL